MMQNLLTVAIPLVVITVAMQAAFSTYWIWLLRRHFTHPNGSVKPHRALLAITSTVVMFLLLHVCQCIVWALAYLNVAGIASLNTFEEALYFSMITFTTLGYGDLTIVETRWRLLGGIEALNGVILLGWTTAFLFLVVQRSWEGMHTNHLSHK